MNSNDILNRLAPCGLHCGKCFAFIDGDIKKSSRQLKESLGNFENYAKRFVDLLEEPVFTKYPDFKELLDYFTTVECKGCRNEKCLLFKDCKIRECHQSKEVDYCFQCNEFPCNHTGFDQHLYKRFVEINQRMKVVGVEQYYKEIKDKPRY